MKVPVITFFAATMGFSHAALVVADFNDMTIGDMRSGQSSAQPSGTGTGFSQDYWSAGTSIVVTVAGDLTAPSGTGYAVTQSGTATSVSAINNNAQRQQARNLTDVFIAGDTVWFTFLFKNTLTTNRTGISLFNTPNGNTYEIGVSGRIIASGKDLHVEGGNTVLTNVFTLGQTYLMLGRIDIEGGTTTGNDAVSIWINPDVSGGVSGLGTASYANADIDFLGTDTQVTKLGIPVYDSGTNTSGRGTIDSIRLSDTASAFADVTIPEPSSLLLSGIGALALLRRRTAL